MTTYVELFLFLWVISFVLSANSTTFIKFTEKSKCWCGKEYLSAIQFLEQPPTVSAIQVLAVLSFILLPIPISYIYGGNIYFIDYMLKSALYTSLERNFNMPSNKLYLNCENGTAPGKALWELKHGAVCMQPRNWEWCRDIKGGWYRVLLGHVYAQNGKLYSPVPSTCNFCGMSWHKIQRRWDRIEKARELKRAEPWYKTAARALRIMQKRAKKRICY